MLGLELDTAKKIQLGIILLTLGFAGGYLYYNWDVLNGTQPDDTITAYAEQKQFGMDQNSPISQYNQVDPLKTQVITQFRCVDGLLRITEYPNDSTRAATLQYVTDPKRTKTVLYALPPHGFASISDPVERALTWAASMLPNRRGVAMLVRRSELNADQAKAELEARQALLDKLLVVDTQISNGSVSPREYQAFLDALAKFKANPDDPTKSDAKKKLAHDVMRLALAYVDRVQQVRGEAINGYVAAVEKIVDSEQRKKLAEALPPNALAMARRASAG